MSEPKEVTVSELRRDLPTILHKVLLLNESFVVVKHGRPFAVLSRVNEGEDYDRIAQKVKDGLQNALPALEGAEADAMGKSPGP